MSKQLTIAKLHTDNNIDIGQYPAGLKDLQQYVGGLIQPVDLGNNVLLLVNEEGKFSQEPLLNNIATMMFEHAYGFGEDYIVGDVVVLSTAGEEFGNLTDDGFQAITRAVEDCQRRARI